MSEWTKAHSLGVDRLMECIQEAEAERDRLRAELELARGVACEMWNRAHEWAETGDGCTWQYLEDYAKAYDWLP